MNYKNYLVFVAIFALFIFGGNIHAYTINGFNIEVAVTNASDVDTPYKISGTLSNTDGIVDYMIPLKITSSEYSDFDFNADVDSNNFTGYFYIDLDAANPAYHSSYPKRPIMVSAGVDTITVEDNNGQLKEDTIKVDDVNPVIGTFTITSLGTTNSNYYRGDVNLNASGYSDADSYLAKYIGYIVTSSNIANYSTSYVKRVQKDSNVSPINLAIGTGLADGNYYVLLDAQDAAGNKGTSQNVIDTNKFVSIDNTKPSVTSFNLGTLANNTVYYVDSNTFLINVVIAENGSGIDADQAATKMVITFPDTSTLIIDYNLTNNGFYYSHTGIEAEGNGDVYKIALDVNDIVDNNLSIDFNIMIDANGPTTPTAPTLTRAVDENITIATWGIATDSGSGLLEYRVYRSTSDFTSYTNQTLICTVLAAATKTCLDTTSKSADTRYYYGVAAVDKAENLGGIVTSSISTGPSLSFDIDDDNTYTKDSTPVFTITTSSDVNALRFSCNASTFTSWIEISDNTDYEYTQFNITSGNGCTTTNGTKTIYIEARSEDDPYPITRKSNTIKYDSVAPTVPSSVKATTQTNGSIKLTWNISTDANSGLDYYVVYYSDSNGVTSSSSKDTAYDETYTLSPNKDQNYYFKVSAIDSAGNESALSLQVTGVAKRFGPSFTITLSPVNVDTNINYLKNGIVNIKAVSDEDLTGTGTIKIKIGTGSYVTILSTTTVREISGDYNVSISGTGTIEISGRNVSNQSATDTISFTLDANIPSFDLNSSVTNGVYTLTPINLPTDVIKVQYLLDEISELCLKDKNSINFSCDFNSFDFEDGNHIISALAYDKALNVGTKKISVAVENVNEVMVEREELLASIRLNLDLIDSELDIYEALLITVNADVNTKLDTVYEKIAAAQTLVGVNEVSANELYNQANNLLIEVKDILPKQSTIKLKTISSKYDSNSSIDLTLSTTDTNAITNTTKLYETAAITVDRNFLIMDVSSQKYYSVSLEFKNSSANPIIITFIEEIPKELAADIRDLIFADKVEVLVTDPVIKHTITIPAKGSTIIRYNKKDPITELDVITKFELINFKSPIILSGEVASNKLIIVSSTIKQKLFTYIGIFVISLLLLLIITWLVVSANKKKPELGKPTAKDEIYNTLGKGDFEKLSKLKDNPSTNNKINEGMGNPIASKVAVDDKFQSNYDFILDAVKRSNRDKK